MKKRRLLSSLAFGLVVLGGAGATFGVAFAQHDPKTHQADPADKDAWLKGDTQKENDVYDLYKQNKLISAATKADEVLQKNPDSILGNFVRGAAYRRAEGDQQRAMFHLGQARKVLEQRYDFAKCDFSCPWKFHRDLLYETQLTAGEMEEYAYQLEILNYYEKLNYEPVLLAEKAWPLMKLDQFDKARAVAKQATESKDPQQVVLGKNALCAIEGEAHTRKAWADACLEAFEVARKAGESKKGKNESGEETTVAVHAYNAALAAFSVLRFDEVERLAHEGTGSKALTIANPWRMLTLYYTSGGRVVEALQAVRSMQSWRMHEPASMRDQDQAETDGVLATLLMVAGESEPAARLVARAIDRPDRRGLVSSKSEQSLAAHLVMRRALARMIGEQASEKASYGNLLDRAKGMITGPARRAMTWTDDERIASLLTDDERLDATFRVYLGGGVELPPWMLGDLVPVLGPGVVEVVLERVHKEEASMPELSAYYDGIEAEVALHQGDYARSVKLADSASKALPKAEALLVARVAAVGGEAARRAGDMATATRLLEVAMQKDSGVIRRLGLALPSVIRTNGGDGAVRRGAELIGRSPRLSEAKDGFVVTVSRVAAKSLRACVSSPAGAELACAETEGVEGESDDAFATRLARDFHREIFTLTFGLSQADLQSLDGSISIASQAQREKMKGMLRDLAEEP